MRLGQTPVGFRTHNLLLFAVELPETRYPNTASLPVLQQIEDKLDAISSSNRVLEMLERALLTASERLATDERIGEGINRWLRVAILRTVAPRRAEIAAFIRKVVENWDAETLVKRIELQVGRDLQYIRINGTLVGGLVGLIIFTVVQWLKVPG